MNIVMDEEIKRWTARRNSALVLEIIQGNTTMAGASRAFDLTPAEIGSWLATNSLRRPSELTRDWLPRHWQPRILREAPANWQSHRRNSRAL